MLLTVGVDRAVREHERAPLAPEDLRIDIAKKKFGRFLRIGDLARTVEEIPGDLKRAFDEDREWFAHKSKTVQRPFRSSGGLQAGRRKPFLD